jgi:superfamily II DNA or RNA helicase
MTPTLRPYQLSLVARFYASTARRSLMVLPTGGGKTVIDAAIVDRWPGRVVVVADREELVEQAARAMPSAGVLIGQTYRPGDGKTMIVGVHTVARRDHRIDASLVIVDEGHMAAAATWRKVMGWYPEARLLLQTATPYRYGGGTLDDLVDEAIAGPSIAELVSMGFLCPVRTFASPDDLARSARIRAGEFVQEDIDRLMRGTVLRSSIVEWAKRATGRKTIAFCCTKAHAHDVADAMRWYGPVEVICEDTPREARRSARDRLTSGGLIALVSVDCLGVGFDCPAADLGLMLRPTMSRGVCRQQAGRIMRTFPGKRDALLLDMAGNVGRHGLPMSPDITTLGGRVVPIPKRGRLVGLLNCPKCLCVYPSDAAECPECHAGKPHVALTVRTVAGTLDEVIGIDATGAQTWAERAPESARMAWVRKKLAAGWSRARISAVYRSMFHTWPDWKRIAA